MRDLLAGRARSRARTTRPNALAAHVGGGSVARFVALMNARPRSSGSPTRTSLNPDGLDAPGHVSSARDVTKLARVAMRSRSSARPCARSTRRVGRAAACQLERPALDVPAPDRRQDGPHRRRRLVGGARPRAGRRDDLRDAARRRDARRAERRSGASCSRGGSRAYRTVWAIDARADYAPADAPTGEPACALVAAKPALRVVRVERPLVERSSRPSRSRCRCARGSGSARCRCSTAARSSPARPLVAAERDRAAGGGSDA